MDPGQKLILSRNGGGQYSEQGTRYITQSVLAPPMAKRAGGPAAPVRHLPAMQRYAAAGGMAATPLQAYNVKQQRDLRDYSHFGLDIPTASRGAPANGKPNSVLRGVVDKSKGLRHFSTKVCEKVKEKGRTNYNEVADELVAEYFDSISVPSSDSDKQQYDMKNIRRRVYDALNVLMAMNIIEKEKKEIRWVGLPTSSIQECQRLQVEKEKRQQRLREKAENLQELMIQLVAYKSLVEKNKERERTEGRPAEGSVLYLPYIIVNTEKRTMVDCAISQDKSEYLFNFDQPFEIHDDIEVLKRLGLTFGLERGDVAVEERERLRQCLPPAIRHYIDEMIDGQLSQHSLGEGNGVLIQQAQQHIHRAHGGGDKRVPIVNTVSRVPMGGQRVVSIPHNVYRGAAPVGAATKYTIVPRPTAGASSQQQQQPTARVIASPAVRAIPGGAAGAPGATARYTYVQQPSGGNQVVRVQEGGVGGGQTGGAAGAAQWRYVQEQGDRFLDDMYDDDENLEFE